MSARHVMIMLVVFLLLGATVNVAVAWALAARRASLSIERYQQGAFVIWDRPWGLVRQDRFGMVDVWWRDLSHDNAQSESAESLVSLSTNRISQRQASGPAMPSGRSVELLSHELPWGTFRGRSLPGGIIMGGDIAFGLPVVSMWMSTTCDLVGNATANEQLHGGWLVRGQIEARGNNFVALPYRIIWQGFALNTIFYAAVLWLLFVAPGTVKRRIRYVRGRCIRCGYDLRGHLPGAESIKCPECGTTANRRCRSHVDRSSRPTLFPE